MKDKIKIATSNDYVKEGYGYKKITKDNTHWITFFEKDNTLQMYAYFTEDNEFEKIYDTGIIKVSEQELQTLINILNTNHN